MSYIERQNQEGETRQLPWRVYWPHAEYLPFSARILPWEPQSDRSWTFHQVKDDRVVTDINLLPDGFQVSVIRLADPDSLAQHYGLARGTWTYGINFSSASIRGPAVRLDDYGLFRETDAKSGNITEMLLTGLSVFANHQDIIISTSGPAEIRQSGQDSFSFDTVIRYAREISGCRIKHITRGVYQLTTQDRVLVLFMEKGNLKVFSGQKDETNQVQIVKQIINSLFLDLDRYGLGITSIFYPRKLGKSLRRAARQLLKSVF